MRLAEYRGATADGIERGVRLGFFLCPRDIWTRNGFNGDTDPSRKLPPFCTESFHRRRGFLDTRALHPWQTDAGVLFPLDGFGAASAFGNGVGHGMQGTEARQKCKNARGQAI